MTDRYETYDLDISTEIKQKYTEKFIHAGYAGELVNNPDLFDQFTRIVCGYKLNREYLRDIKMDDNPCKNHVPAFHAIYNMYSYEEGKSFMWCSSRGGGKTLDVGILNIANNFTKPEFSANCAGSVLEQANEGWSKVDSIVTSNPVLLEYCSKLTMKKTTTIPFDDGQTRIQPSSLGIVVANKRGLNSKHPNTLIIDEFELIEDPDILNDAVLMIRENKKWHYPAQLIYISSLKFSSGIMTDIMRNQKKRGFTVYISCIFENAEKCFDRSCSRCDLAEDCRGILQKKKYSDHYTIDNILEQKSKLSIEQWRMQMLSQVQKPYGTVYNREWDRDDHVLKGEYVWNPNWETYGGRDFGEGGEQQNNDIHLLCQVNPNRELFWFYERRDNGASGGLTTESLANFDKELTQKYNVLEWFVDPRGTPYIASMKNAGLRLNTMKALKQKYQDRVGEKEDISSEGFVADGIIAVKTMLRTANNRVRMFFCPKGCKQLIDDMESNYMWKNQKIDGVKMFVDKPASLYSHAPDTVRYVISNLFPTLSKGGIRQIDSMDRHMPFVFSDKSTNIIGLPSKTFGDDFFEKCGHGTISSGNDRISFEGF